MMIATMKHEAKKAGLFSRIQKKLGYAVARVFSAGGATTTEFLLNQRHA
jgi:hypothetical protein